MSDEEVCPVCLGSENEMFVLSCSHKIHLECCKGLTSLNCILCDRPVYNFPEDISIIIQQNGKNRKEELLEQDRQTAIEMVANGEPVAATAEIIVPPLEMEIQNAIDFLTENNVPQFLIPNVSITSQPHPSPPPGTVFTHIVNETLNKLNAFVENVEEEDFSDED